MSKLPPYRSRLGDGANTCYEPTPPRRRSDVSGCGMLVLVVIAMTIGLYFAVPGFFEIIAALGHAFEAWANG
jgi:hypothetical protein